MAVPGRNGVRDGDDGLFEPVVEHEWPNDDLPPHHQAVADACSAGDVSALAAALDNLNNLGGHIDEPIEDGDTALHLCCLYGKLPCVQLLLDRGADIEVKDAEGSIALHDACAGGYTHISELLLNVADSECVKRMITAVDVEGDTPLHHAARGEHLGCSRLLVAAGASPTRINIYGKIPAELADPDTEAKRYLEEAAASANSLPGQ